ncbi:hypothetical protein ACFCV9_27120 [Streptomyces sp. NPDC056367]|uniref:hypothetical protein n=1 Tax=Streptomyces sp. NPDC056367 TaxID=3345797 RepID=UPI0035E34E34
MASADAPSPWSEDDLAEFHRIVLWALLRCVSPPPGAEEHCSGRPVRGVLRPPGRPEHTRIVLWDGHDTATSVAYDLPLLAPDGSNVAWSAIIGMLRQLASGPGAAELAAAGPVARDGLGIPVVDAGAEASRFQEEPSYDLTDALHAAVSMVGPYAWEPEPEREELLTGFVLLDTGTVRMYMDRPQGPPGRIGLDFSLRDDAGRVREGFTGTMAAVPSLLRDDLSWARSPAEDPYCVAVYDLTHW